MATPLDLPLPEITSEEFQQAWTRFELVAAAKEWNDERKKLVLPTLLHGKLVEYYVEADDATYSWGSGKLKELLNDQSWSGTRPFNIKPVIHVAHSTPG